MGIFEPIEVATGPMDPFRGGCSGGNRAHEEGGGSVAATSDHRTPTVPQQRTERIARARRAFADISESEHAGSISRWRMRHLVKTESLKVFHECEQQEKR